MKQIIGMLKRIFVFLYFIVFQIQAQELPPENTIFSQKAIYFICRGTKAKAGLVAGQFNLADKKITHVGLGFYNQNGVFLIYNMSVAKEHPFLITNEWETFKEDGTFYMSVWKMPATDEELKKIESICKKTILKAPRFDFQFSLKTKNELYCSEFCFRVLKKLNSKKFKLKPQTKTLNEFYQHILACKKLRYYPVDFFQSYANTNKIYEIDFSLSAL